MREADHLGSPHLKRDERNDMNTNNNNNPQETRVYQHSDLAYWWVVWLYGFFCAGLTYWPGVAVAATLPGFASNEVYVYPNPWLGVSFVLLAIAIAIFTNVQNRGAHVLAVLVTLIVAVGAPILAPILDRDYEIIRRVQPFVYMTWELYLLISSILFAAWILAIVYERRNYYHFHPRNLVIGTFGGDQDDFVFQSLNTRKTYPPLVTRILGLGLTGDLTVKISAPGAEPQYELKNVWMVRRKAEQISVVTSGAALGASPAPSSTKRD